MKAIKRSTTLKEDGLVTLGDIPAKKGERVEVIILIEERKSDKEKLLKLAGFLSEEEGEEFKAIIS